MPLVTFLRLHKRQARALAAANAQAALLRGDEVLQREAQLVNLRVEAHRQGDRVRSEVRGGVRQRGLRQVDGHLCVLNEVHSYNDVHLYQRCF